MLQLKVIVGSTRVGRAADLVIPWIIRRLRDDARFEVDLLDLRDWSLTSRPSPTSPKTNATCSRLS